MLFGIRLIAGLIGGLVTGALFLFFISQVLSDPLQFLVFGFGSEILGFMTYCTWKASAATIVGDISGVVLLLPLIYIAISILYQSPSQSMTATNWPGAYIQGLPASIIGDLGGTLAAVVMGF